MDSTGKQAAECLLRTLRVEIAPVWVLVKPGVMVPSIFSATGMEPLKSIVIDSIQASERSDRYLDVPIFAGFPMPMSRTAASRWSLWWIDTVRRRSILLTVSSQIGMQRKAMSYGELLPSVESGIDTAKKLVCEGRRPVILLEHADRMHDSTYVLREVLGRKLPWTAVPYLSIPMPPPRLSPQVLARQ
ncbi:hypothetical protein X772_33805 [Mesorhizobium sp. LSJC280B00]|nr:hypothetical protein X772_33805 [Mesorhizobium sp. LSJC280B00]